MGLLIDGKWHEGQPARAGRGGAFSRAGTAFHGWVTADGSSGFPAEAGRYHLYVSLACPWASRTLIVRKLKRLEAVIGLSIVDPVMGQQGWAFGDTPGCIPDTVNGKRYLHEIYTLAEPAYTGRVTVPVLWDRRTAKIVNNESSEIIRMLNSAFDAFGDSSVDLYPAALRAEIDRINAFVYASVNNGVYRAGFAREQGAYEAAYDALFDALDRLEQRLAGQRYLAGDQITEADWRLFTTLVRFDPVYHGHFKCNRQKLKEFHNLWNYMLELYQVPGVAETVNIEHCKIHYYMSHTSINPNRIVPKGPDIDFAAPHDRGRLGGR